MNTKLHAICDSQGRPIDLFLTAGPVSDYIGARALVSRLDLACHVGRQQPVAVPGEHRRHSYRIVDPEAHEPAKQQIILQVFHQLSLGAD